MLFKLLLLQNEYRFLLSKKGACLLGGRSLCAIPVLSDCNWEWNKLKIEVSNNAFLRSHIENGEALRACSMDLYGIRDSSCD